ncbi:spore coat U domain-containing protein [uncultured Massilia sp.]|uniref:Csu type fimbrial protein n=1 Tax=uncultured Massilia sp. TaxID=169973 RepID=UPI0025F4456C|nr:spore coat U domain-containing protein [uncultured Massilia sp.]
MKTTAFLVPLLLALWLLAPPAARADTCGAAMTDVVFSNVNPIAGTDVYASGTLTVTCSFSVLSPNTLLPTLSVCVSLGGAGGAWRTMSSGSATLPFNLYTDSSYTAAAIWGSAAVPGTAQFSFSGGGLLGIGSGSKSWQVYGKIPGSAIRTVPTSGGADTTYVADFSGRGVIQYAFGGLATPSCTTGSSAAFSFQARATVVNDCQISVGQLSFGTSKVLNAAVRASTTMSVLCTAGKPYQVSLSAGNYGSGGARRMRNAATGETVGYQLSSSYDGSQWGDGGGGGGVPLGGTGTGAAQAITVYGRVSPQATPSPGDYTDTVTATLYF